MQEFRVKALDLPDDLFDITNAVKEDEPSFDKNDASDFNRESYIKSFIRQIDPVIICLFYGLYKSKKLPEKITAKVKFNNNREFNANISKPIEELNNLLYALWIKENQIPEKASDLLKYRKKLYDFLEDIQNYNNIVSTIIPYYLSIADEAEGDRSFINRMKHSGYCRYESNDVSPEYIALIFIQAQEDFMNYIKINEIVQKMNIPNINLDRDEKGKMEKKELRDTVEKRINQIEIDLRKFLHIKIHEKYSNYWNNIENCMKIKNDTDTKILQYLASNKTIARDSVNPFDFMSFFDYFKMITREFWPVFEPVFQNPKMLESYFKDISDIRNSIKHNRDLTVSEIQKADVALPWFESILNSEKI